MRSGRQLACWLRVVRAAPSIQSPPTNYIEICHFGIKEHMKKILIDSEELRMCVVSTNDGEYYTLVFDGYDGGVALNVTRAQAFTLIKTLGDDLVKGISLVIPPDTKILVPVVTPEL